MKGETLQGDGIHCQEKAQMVLKSSSAQMTSPEQLASTGREENFNSGQSGPGLSPLNLVTSWCPLPSLCSSCPPPLSLFIPPWLPLCRPECQPVVCSSSDCLASRRGWPQAGSQVLICIQGPGPGHSFNLIKPGRNEVCMN